MKKMIAAADEGVQTGKDDAGKKEMTDGKSVVGRVKIIGGALCLLLGCMTGCGNVIMMRMPEDTGSKTEVAWHQDENRFVSEPQTGGQSISVSEAQTGGESTMVSEAQTGGESSLISESWADSEWVEAPPYEIYGPGVCEWPLLYAQYEPFGLSRDQNGALYFEGEAVRYFHDGVSLGDGGYAMRCEYLNTDGSVDVHTVRREVQNADGSTDPFGILIGLGRDSREDFESRDLSYIWGGQVTQEATAAADGGSCEEIEGISFEERFEVYKEYGIVYIESETASGAGNVYYNGELAGVFIDAKPDGGVFLFHSRESGGLSVRTVYDTNGVLAGVESMPLGG